MIFLKTFIPILFLFFISIVCNSNAEDQGPLSSEPIINSQVTSDGTPDKSGTSGRVSPLNPYFKSKKSINIAVKKPVRIASHTRVNFDSPQVAKASRVVSKSSLPDPIQDMIKVEANQRNAESALNPIAVYDSKGHPIPMPTEIPNNEILTEISELGALPTIQSDEQPKIALLTASHGEQSNGRPGTLSVLEEYEHDDDNEPNVSIPAIPTSESISDQKDDKQNHAITSHPLMSEPIVETVNNLEDSAPKESVIPTLHIQEDNESADNPNKLNLISEDLRNESTESDDSSLDDLIHDKLFDVRRLKTDENDSQIKITDESEDKCPHQTIHSLLQSLRKMSTNEDYIKSLNKFEDEIKDMHFLDFDESDKNVKPIAIVTIDETKDTNHDSNDHLIKAVNAFSQTDNKLVDTDSEDNSGQNKPIVVNNDINYKTRPLVIEYETKTVDHFENKQEEHHSNAQTSNFVGNTAPSYRYQYPAQTTTFIAKPQYNPPTYGYPKPNQMNVPQYNRYNTYQFNRYIPNSNIKQNRYPQQKRYPSPIYLPTYQMGGQQRNSVQIPAPPQSNRYYNPLLNKQNRPLTQNMRTVPQSGVQNIWSPNQRIRSIIPINTFRSQYVSQIPNNYNRNTYSRNYLNPSTKFTQNNPFIRTPVTNIVSNQRVYTKPFSNGNLPNRRSVPLYRPTYNNQIIGNPVSTQNNNRYLNPSAPTINQWSNRNPVFNSRVVSNQNSNPLWNGLNSRNRIQYSKPNSQMRPNYMIQNQAINPFNYNNYRPNKGFTPLVRNKINFPINNFIGKPSVINRLPNRPPVMNTLPIIPPVVNSPPNPPPVLNSLPNPTQVMAPISYPIINNIPNTVNAGLSPSSPPNPIPSSVLISNSNTAPVINSIANPPLINSEAPITSSISGANTAPVISTNPSPLPIISSNSITTPIVNPDSSATPNVASDTNPTIIITDTESVPKTNPIENSAPIIIDLTSLSINSSPTPKSDINSSPILSVNPSPVLTTNSNSVVNVNEKQETKPIVVSESKLDDKKEVSPKVMDISEVNPKPNESPMTSPNQISLEAPNSSSGIVMYSNSKTTLGTTPLPDEGQSQTSTDSDLSPDAF